MTWSEALQVADDQIAHWQAIGVGAREAEEAITLTDHPERLRWQMIRYWLATWAIDNRESWKD